MKLNRWARVTLLMTIVIGLIYANGVGVFSATAATCLLSNGDFEAASLSPWIYQNGNGSQATFGTDTGYNSAKSVFVSIQNPGPNWWDISLGQKDFTMAPGRRYTLTFWARASQTRTFDVTLQKWEQPFTEIWKKNYSITTSWQKFEVEIDYPSSAVTTTPALWFQLGQRAGSVWIDAVSLCETASQPPPPTPQVVAQSCRVANGNFETGSFSPWAFQTSAPAQATLETDAGANGATSARINISQNSANAPDIRFSQSGMTTSNGQWMALQFFAKSSRGQTIQVSLESDDGAVIWTRDIPLPDPAQDAAFKHFFFTFQTVASNNATLKFNLGKNLGSVWIDAVFLCNAPQKFADEFGGNVVDGSKWRHCRAYTEQCAETLFPGLLSWYKPSNAVVSNGTLKMNVTKETGTVCLDCKFGGQTYITRDYASVYLQSNETFATEYGYLEARMKMPKTRGLWFAMWLLPHIPLGGQAKWPPEIDVLEFYPHQPNLSWHTIHFSTATEFNVGVGSQYQHPFNLGDDFHVYSANWTPNEIIWYVDGMETFRTSREKINGNMYLVLSVEVGGPLAGAVDSSLPDPVTEVDYYRVFSNADAFGFGSSPTQPTSTPAPGATSTPIPTLTPTRRPTRIVPTITPGPSPTIDPRLKVKTFLPALLDED